MWNPFKRIAAPLVLKVDFTDPYWNISAGQARCWLGGAVAADLLVQWVAGLPNVLTVLASLLTLAIFWAIPARLSGAVGGLYIGQALVSLPVVTAAAMMSGNVAEIAGIAWSGLCLFALVRLILGYIRTPKALM
ncbi:hypothetical protein WJ96_07515 [Burkholderia ubonensis]|uniref:Uncharacterized protein n=1 Tax=Burkholderia ubonensis TaxID=101571 RepID=A0AAW3MRY2_9BURK|nr:hypothetical protein [Burkholderia ubonensis]KVP75545.1 hypothetical protein WJ93_09305 [Burkholderia ubonensis]KVP98359.1 hypothetical protein WJ96_07515 [Burkholderia ubonensis]KVZ93057.1 hypothetical protein WL25_19175 [Burkholderia ubonensis]